MKVPEEWCLEKQEAGHGGSRTGLGAGVKTGVTGDRGHRKFLLTEICQVWPHSHRSVIFINNHSDKYLSFKNILNDVYVCASMCECVHVNINAHRGQKRVLGTPGAGVEEVVSFLTWVLGTELLSSGKAVFFTTGPSL